MQRHASKVESVYYYEDGTNVHYEWELRDVEHYELGVCEL